MAVLQILAVVAALTIAMGVAYTAGLAVGNREGRAGHHEACNKRIGDAEASQGEAEGYAGGLEAENVFLRMQVRGLSRQLEEHGVGPWTTSDDTPPAPIKGQARRVLH